jgi:hypothetical protein
LVYNTIMKTNQSQDILAKLLATENVTVVRKNVATASFDIKNRVLTLPQWKKLTTEIEEMLILHEVGHALYTTEAGYGIVYTEKRHLRGYSNIIEDVRIEKKMKDRYPGSRKTFNAGYTQLNERDFFGVADRDLSELLLIDKINLYYKAGYACGVTFTAEEYAFVQKADKCITEEDVIELAEEIYNFSKQKKLEEDEENQEEGKRRVKRGQRSDGNDDPYDDYEMSDEEYEEDDSESEVDVEPETMDNFEKSLDKHQDRDSRTFYLDAEFEVKGNDPLIPYRKVLEELYSRYEEEYIPVLKSRASTFKTESTNIVNYLVKEFEMRKSASAYKRTKISKLGQLDTRKLFAYKLKDDLFKQIATVQEGKKHGMIFLLDWSGSMMNYMYETVEQVINLAMFCQKINIPYQVLAFTDGYARDHQYPPVVVNGSGVDNMNMFSMLELFSNKMNTREFNKMLEILLDRPWNKRNNYGLNGTPLNHSLMYMIEYIGKFIHVNNVEKMNLIVLTDGESNVLHHYDYNGENQSGIKCGPTYVTEDGKMTKVNSTTLLRDKVTRKEYEFTDDSCQQTATLMQLLKDRYGIRTTGFFVTGSNARTIERFLKYNISEENLKSNQRFTQALDIQTKLRRDKAVVLKNIPARDEMYIILSTNKIEDEDLNNVKSDMSASQISKQLTKMFTSRKASRVVLNSFIGVVA